MNFQQGKSIEIGFETIGAVFQFLKLFFDRQVIFIAISWLDNHTYLEKNIIENFNVCTVNSVNDNNSKSKP